MMKNKTASENAGKKYIRFIGYDYADIVIMIMDTYGNTAKRPARKQLLICRKLFYYSTISTKILEFK